MRPLFIDENLPRSLCGRLGRLATHATDCGIRLEDREIWEPNRVPGGIVVTQDADFSDRVVLEGPPPQVIWVRTGNMGRREPEEFLVGMWPEIERILAESALIEVYRDRLVGMVLGS